MLGVGLLFIGGALATSPTGTGLFELDKNANNAFGTTGTTFTHLATAHVGVIQSSVKATDTTLPVCEYSGTPPTLLAGATLMIDGEQMTFVSYGTIKTSTGGCSFTDPAITPTQVRNYTVTRGQNGTTAASHAGDSDITQLSSAAAASTLPADWNQVYADVTAPSPTTPNACSDLTGSVACDWINDPPGVTIFTGGSSDTADISGWTCTNQSVPDADEILDAYAIKYSNSDQFIYFGADRFATNGSKDFGFWFFKNPISSSGATISNTCPTGAFSGGNHVPGDVLLLGTFSQGGAVSNIRVFEWVASGGDVSTHLQTEGTFGDCLTSSADGCNTINNTTIPSPWPYAGKGAAANNVIYSGGFMEGGIDLTPLHLTGCFSSFMAETRSSPSLTAELKDFTIGKFEACGSKLVSTPQAGDGSALHADTNSNNLVEASIGAGTVSVRDSALLTVTGTPSFVGTMSFHICGPITSGTCSTGGVDESQTNNAANANGTYFSKAVNLTSVGRYCWRADFTSTTNGVPPASDSTAESSSGTGECFEVLPVTPSLVTTAVNCTTHVAIGTGPVDFGTSICDKGTLGSTVSTATQPGTNGGDGAGHYLSIGATAGAAAGGKITFTLRGADQPNANPPVCSTATAAISAGTNPEDVTSISGNNSYFTTGATPSSPGPYHWIAQYVPATGDPNNVGSTYNNDCGDTNEAVTVRLIPTDIRTNQSWYPNDTARIASTVSGDNILAGGTVDFLLYDNATCSGNLKYNERVTIGAGDISSGVASVPTHNYVGGGGSPVPSNSWAAYAIPTALTDTAGTAVNYSWKVVYTPAGTDTAHEARQSACTPAGANNGVPNGAASIEKFTITYTNDNSGGSKP